MNLRHKALLTKPKYCALSWRQRLAIWPSAQGGLSYANALCAATEPQRADASIAISNCSTAATERYGPR